MFIELNDKYLRELCPLLGSCIKIHKLVQMSKEPPTVYSHVSVVQLPNFESCTSGVANNQPADLKSDKVGDVFLAVLHDSL